MAKPDAASASDGDLDTTFGTGGKVTTDFSAAFDAATAVAIQGDGKILVAGQADSGASNFGLARYLSTGALDSSFGTGGKVTTLLGLSSVANAMALQPDGKIVLAGWSSNGSNTDFAVARYRSDGTLDPAFGAGGKVITPIGTSDDVARAIALQADGKILVGGYRYASSNHDFALVRYNPDGSLDTDFGTGGKVTTSFGTANDVGTGLAVQSDSKIILGGYYRSASNGDDFAIARYNTDGSLDSTFGSGGKVTTTFTSGNDASTAVLLQPDGKILAAGLAQVSGNNDFAVARYNTDGSLDSAGFGTNGKLTTPVGLAIDNGQAMALQLDGKILVGGYVQVGSTFDFGLVRYMASGSLDSTFGTGGKVITAIGSGHDIITALAVQSNGKILAAGRADGMPTTDWALLRYNSSLPNSAPTAVNDNYATEEENTLNVSTAAGVLANDTDPENDSLIAVLDTDVSYGTLSLNLDGSFTYSPDPNFCGEDAFTYHADDAVNNSNSASVTITVAPVNDAPVGVNDAYSTGEDQPLSVGSPGVLSNDTDIEADPLTAVPVSGPSHGSVTLNGNGSFDYSPNPNYNGADSFTYRASDGLASSAPVTVNITLTPVNDAPVAADDSATTDHDVPISIPVLGNDSDPDSDPLSVTSATQGSQGSVTFTQTSVTYTPAVGTSGPDTFSYTIGDGHGGSATADVHVLVFAPFRGTTLETTLITGGQTRSGSFSSSMKQGYRFNACTGRTYVIQTSNLGPSADTLLRLYAGDGTTLITADDNGGGGLSSRISWTCPASGTYYLEALQADGSTGPDRSYDVTITGDTNACSDWSLALGDPLGHIADMTGIVEMNDGGTLSVGFLQSSSQGGDDALLVRTNNDGDIAWQRILGTAANDDLYSIEPTGDGGYVAAGNNGSDMWLVKLNSAGEINCPDDCWQRRIAGTGTETLRKARQTSDGGYIAVGSSNSPGNYDFAILKTNSSGQLNWQKTFGGPGTEVAYDVLQTSGGDYMIAGLTDSLSSRGYDALVIKLHPDGSLAWQRSYGTAATQMAKGIHLAGSGYTISGDTSEGGGNDFWLLNFDEATGNVQWAKYYQESSDDHAYFSTGTIDGGYVMVGGAGSVLQVVRVDSAGALSWSRNYSGSGKYWAEAVSTATDAGFLVGGRDSGVRALSMKIGADGLIASGTCSGTNTGSLTPANSSATLLVTGGSLSTTTFSESAGNATSVSGGLSPAVQCSIQLPREVSPPGALQQLKFGSDKSTLNWEPASNSGSATFDVYRGDIADLPTGNFGTCQQSGFSVSNWSDGAVPATGNCWFYEVSGKNALGEGPLGFESDGTARPNNAPCP